MIMGQTKLIHEHYDRKPWASIISTIIISLLAMLKLANAIHDHTWILVALFCVVILPSIGLLVMDIIWRNKPTLVVYNDRLEVWKPLSSQRTEIMYSDIRNIALEAGQLQIWLDEYSIPSCHNMGAKLAKAQESYDILRAAYDQYNQEHGIKPVPVASLPKKKMTKGQLVFFVTFACVLGLLLILNHIFH